ncbi:MAG: recombinase family protein [Rhodobacteraceae bacterium]|nr:recombinase family protein [Paracoccaceae bacterium]
MIAGYARVSTKDQSVDVQVAQLRALGCDEIYTDHVSGKNMNRAGLKACLERLQTGDTLIVQAYDRLGRSVSDLLNITEGLRKKGVQFKSIRESVDTSTPLGELFFNISSSFAQFERDLISQRTKIGLDAARAQGRVGGRPKLLTDDQLKDIEETIIKTAQPFSKISTQYAVSVATLYKAFPGGRAALVKTRFKIVSDYSYGQECFQIIEDTKGSGFYWRVSAEGAASHSSPMGPFPSMQAALDECAGLASGAI